MELDRYQRNLIVIATGVVGLFAVVGVYIYQESVKVEKYIDKHQCRIIDYKTTIMPQTIVTPNGTGANVRTIMTPVTKHLYECDIVGERGSSFWY